MRLTVVTVVGWRGKLKALAKWTNKGQKEAFKYTYTAEKKQNKFYGTIKANKNEVKSLF